MRQVSSPALRRQGFAAWTLALGRFHLLGVITFYLSAQDDARTPKRSSWTTSGRTYRPACRSSWPTATRTTGSPPWTTTMRPAPSRPPGRAATTTVHGVNWADPRDNFTDDAVVPTGLSTSDSYATTSTKAGRILDGFRTDLGATTVRLPVNPPSVGTTWWNSYTGAIDAAVARGYTVILSYWEANSSRDGKVDNSTSF